jgi:hypothetical protein
MLASSPRFTLPRLALFAVLLAGGVAPLAPALAGAKTGRPPAVRMNQIQTINTHNSYKRETSEAEQNAFDALIQRPDNYDNSLAYSHASLTRQFDDQDVRGIELDLFPDPQGGLYAEPLVRRNLGLGPLPDPAWRQPGIKVMHIADADYNTTCVLLTACLREVKRWSDANAGHVPLFVMLELKQSDRNLVALGGVTAPPWDATRLDELDQEILSVFDRDELVTPDDIRRRGLTLDQSVARYGWPTLDRTRGKVMFFFNNLGSTSPYSEGHPNLEDRVGFVNAPPGEPNAAYRGRDEVLQLFDEIQGLVSRNYIVRTRSDLPLSTVRSGDTTLLEAGLASGAQIISTDFPAVGMAARYGSDFVARLPERLPARCNPVNAPPGCRSDRLER